MSRDRAWESRPWAARFVKLVAFLGPVLVAIVVTVWVGRQLPVPASFGAALGAWLLLGLLATAIVVLLQRVARRLLPIAALLKLSLAFPGEVPSRYKIARTRGGSRELQAEVDRAREHGLSDDRTEAAVTVLRLVAALSTHDSATRGHAERVRVFVDMIAEEMDLAETDVDRLRWAALLHDVGKIAVHPDVLNHPGRPSEDAWELLRTHPLEGARITAPLRPWLGHWALAIEQHHERWDGEGYPHGIAGDDLSLGARIVAVADAYDVMTAARAYKQPLPAQEAREELARHAGTQFDPDIVRAFLGIPLNRLRWAIGPFSWLVATPFGRPFQSLSSGAGTAAAVATAVLAGSASLGLPAGTPADLPEIDEVQESVEPSSEPEAAFVVTSEEVTVDEDGLVTIDVLGDESPPDGVTLSLVEASVDVGEVSWDEAGTITWTPPEDFNGTATIRYVVSNGTETAEGQVSVTITPVNDPPLPIDDVATVRDDGPQVIDLLGNDSDPDGDELTIVDLDLADVTRGTVTDNGDGTITYTPRRGAAGTDTLVYVVSDGTVEASATLDVLVVTSNDPPRAVGDVVVLNEDGTADVDVLANDVDPDGDALRITGVSLVGASTAVRDGVVTVTPTPDTSGTLRGTVTVTDGTDSATSPLEVRVLSVNDAPTITLGAAQTSRSGTGPVTRTGWAAGITAGPPDESSQVVSIGASVTDTSLFTSLPALDPATGTLTYEFAAGASGTTTVTFTVRDDGGTLRGGRDTTVVRTTLTAVAGPFVEDDAATTQRDQAVIIRVLDNDDPAGGGALTVRQIGDGSTQGNVIDLGDGVLRYEPAPGATGQDTFTYVAGNSIGQDTARVTITIQP